MKALDSLQARDTVIIDKRERSKVSFEPRYDSAASIQLVSNLNDNITYNFNAGSNQFAVLSEVYYPHGWTAFIDGKETPIVRVNYVLRGLAIPAGSHKIELKFEPSSYKTGNAISMIVGGFSILILIGGLWWEWRKWRRTEPVSAKA
jgi:uncharacterized membrane protein YfhO